MRPPTHISQNIIGSFAKDGEVRFGSQADNVGLKSANR